MTSFRFILSDFGEKVFDHNVARGRSIANLLFIQLCGRLTQSTPLRYSDGSYL